LVVVTTVAVSPRTRRSLLVPLFVAMALVASLAATTPARAADEPFRFDLYQDGDFVSQTNVYQCVGASMQMMLNLASSSANRSSSRQAELQTLARSFRRNSNVFNNPSGTTPGNQGFQPRGASSRGWANGLTKLGLGHYRVTTKPSLEEAITTAAIHMRRTGLPVGLLVWHGRHAWVVSGFEATGDPLYDADAEITHVWVLDPFYPRTSSRWGRMAPHTKLTLDQLAQDWVEWRRRGDSAVQGPRWAMILPLVESRVVDRRLHNLS
jgi:hypothetical protein